MKLIPVNENLENEVLAELEKTTGLNSVEKFISLYNQNMYQASNARIQELLELLQVAYTNIETGKKYIAIMSEEETILISLQELLKEWRFISSLKSLAMQMLAEGSAEFERIVFNKKNGGIPLIVDKDDNTKLKRHWSGKSLSNDFEREIKGNTFLVNLMEDYSKDGSMNTVAFEIGKLALIDDSFVISMRDYLVKSANETVN